MKQFASLRRMVRLDMIRVVPWSSSSFVSQRAPFASFGLSGRFMSTSHRYPLTSQYPTDMIPDPIQKALSESLGIQTLTPAQQKLISAFLAGRDIIYKDGTGTGKTMGLVISSLVLAHRHLGLLSSRTSSSSENNLKNTNDIDTPLTHVLNHSKAESDSSLELSSIARAVLEHKNASSSERLSAQAIPPSLLWIVPTRELGWQIHDWMKHIVETMDHSPTTVKLTDWVYCLMGGMDISLQKKFLENCIEYPRIIIATPKRLSLLLENDESSSPPSSGIKRILDTRTLILDEADTLFEIKTRYSRLQSKKQQHLHRHPHLAHELIKKILSHHRRSSSSLLSSRFFNNSLFSPESILTPPSHSSEKENTQDKRKNKRHIQLVASSATMNSPLRFLLKNPSSGLMPDPIMIDPMGSRHFLPEITHHVYSLRLQDLSVENPGSEQPEALPRSEWKLVLDSITKSSDSSDENVPKETPSSLLSSNSSTDVSLMSFDNFLQRDLHRAISHVSEFIKQQTIEKCIVFLPDTVSFRNTMDAFNQNGLQSVGFVHMLRSEPSQRTRGLEHDDIPPTMTTISSSSSTSDGNMNRTRLFDSFLKEPSLSIFLTTPAGGRGLDLPNVRNVILLGISSFPRDDVYIHMAGRASRFGEQGRVFTLIGSSEKERGELVRMWKRLRIH